MLTEDDGAHGQEGDDQECNCQFHINCAVEDKRNRIKEIRKSNSKSFFRILFEYSPMEYELLFALICTELRLIRLEKLY